MDLEWIRKGLKKPGKTRAGIARAMGGINPSQVTRLLAGKRQLKAAEVPKIAAYLGESPPNGHIHISQPTGGLPNPEEIAQARRAQEILFKIAGVPIDDRSLAASLEVVRTFRSPE